MKPSLKLSALIVLSACASFEPAGPQEDYSGEYLASDGWVSAVLELEPDLTYRFRSHDDTGASWGDDGGKYEVNGARIVLDNGKKHVLFEVVSWGERRYLLKESDFLPFCNSVNGGLERTNPMNFLYWPESSRWRASQGLPDVPDRWKPYLLIKPVEGKVARVEGGRIVLDRGSRAGLLKGMRVYVGPEHEHFDIRDVDRATSSADPCGKPGGISAGHSFTTRRWHLEDR